jgi:hypothetical protein
LSQLVRCTTRALTAAAALTLPTLLAPSCADVLQLNDYESAIEALCKCDAVVPQFDGNCVETLGDRLNNASEVRREQWLAHYADNCAGSCDNAYLCFQQVGTCSVVSCTEDNECCGYTKGGSVRCAGDGTCRDCSGSTC